MNDKDPIPTNKLDQLRISLILIPEVKALRKAMLGNCMFGWIGWVGQVGRMGR
jgi:hypothetical protein